MRWYMPFLRADALNARVLFPSSRSPPWSSVVATALNISSNSDNHNVDAQVLNGRRVVEVVVSRNSSSFLFYAALCTITLGLPSPCGPQLCRRTLVLGPRDTLASLLWNGTSVSSSVVISPNVGVDCARLM